MVIMRRKRDIFFVAGILLLPIILFQHSSIVRDDPGLVRQYTAGKQNDALSGAIIGEVADPVNDPLKVFGTDEKERSGKQVFPAFVNSHIDSLLVKRQRELNRLKSPGEWRARQLKSRGKLQEYFGDFPERTPLNAKTVGKLEHPRYRVEKVIFESQPRYYVTANLYVPKDRKFPLPGVVFPCGHYPPAKAWESFQKACQGLVLKGYVVLIFDPMGQGERSEYFDAKTHKDLILECVDQHHYVGRPAFLTGWTLSGLRTWDCIRAVDYLVSRAEVDQNKLAAIGCSGGGQMALLITAVDERIKVCAASHPGGSMEQSFLTGQTLTEREIFSLIPPRPVRIIVGSESGEAPGHRKRLEDMQLFYKGLLADEQRSDLDIVPGVHSMNRANRESVYEWLNRWFDKEEEGKEEPAVQPGTVQSLWCTESGNTILSLGGETAQTLNAKRAARVYKPEKDPAELKKRVAARIGLKVPQIHKNLKTDSIATVFHEGIAVEMLTYESEKGMVIPALLIKPQKIKPDSPVYLFASDKGKPQCFCDTALPFRLAQKGAAVLAVDVRGIGETNPTAPLRLDQYTGYTPQKWKLDVLAIRSAAFGRTILGMRTLDVLRGVDLLHSRGDLKGRKIIVVGEGLGGVWALLAAIYDPRVEGVVTIGTLPSYRLLISHHYYNVWGYFWVPGALRDFDITDLAGLVAPKPQIWIDPVNELGKPMDHQHASSLIGKSENRYVFTPDRKPSKDLLLLFDKTFN